MKARRSIYNLIFGFGSLLTTYALGIIIPRLFLVNFGSEINGLLSSINQVLVYLVLFEAGVGTASIQALYKPISEGDKININSVLAATSIYYKKTGAYYFLAVLIFSIVYPFAIETNLNKYSISVIILLSGMGGVINYFFQGKYKLLLTAEGKEYINTSISALANILTNVIRIILLVLGYNILVIQMSYFFISIIQMIAVIKYIKKYYSWIDLTVKPNFHALSQKKSVLIHQISSLIFSNTDIIILTVFCGLKVVSVYVIYNLVFTMINTIATTVSTSILFILGQSYHEGKEKYIKIYDAYELYFTSFVFALFTIAFILILPFVKLYTEGISDINYIDHLLPFLFVTLNLLSCARIPANNAINVAGHFKKTQTRSILESTINIICSLIFVNIFGIYGVLMGTIIALLYRSIDMIIYANTKILIRSPLITIKRWIIDVGIIISAIFISNIIGINPNSYSELIFDGFILILVTLPLYFIVASLVEKEVFRFTLGYFKIYLNKLLLK